MRPSLPDPSSPVAPHIVAFVQHKRSLNRQYDVEDKALRLFDRYLNEAGVRTLGEISPAILDAFFLSRPRNRSRSFNHLVGVVSRLFEWMVEHDIIDRSPVTMKPRRRGQARPPCILGVEHGQRLVDMAERFSDRNKAPLRGPTYATIFSLLFGLGLRVGEAARLRWGDVDRNRGILTIRETKFSKSRLVPMGPRLANRLSAFMNMRMKGTPGLAGDAPVFSFTGGRPINPGTISLVFHAL
jgi:site-specific recombinase XerD